MSGPPPIACLPAKSTARRLRFARLQRIALRPGDEIRIEGTPDGGETAALDYIEMESGSYFPWHLPPGQRLFSSQTYSYRPAASHSGLAVISNSCDQAAVKIFGSSMVSL